MSWSREVAALDQRDAERLEEIRARGDVRNDRVQLSRRQRLALDPKGIGVALPVGRQRVGDRGRFHSRHTAGAAEHFVVEGQAGAGVVVLPVAGRNQHRQDLPRRRGESAGHTLQIHEAAEEQSRAHQQHQRNRDFGDHQSRPRAPAGPAGATARVRPL